MTVRVEIDRGPFRGIAARELGRRARVMMRVLKRGTDELSILVTDDEHIHQLNKMYRKKDRPTDVLAFAMNEGEFTVVSSGLLGDVIISAPTAARQGEERGVAVLDEVTMLLAHGLLHLLGWDHETPAKDRAMRAETERLCTACLAPSTTPKIKKPAKAQTRNRGSIPTRMRTKV